jgi:signal transduction histidine kinase
VTEIGCPARLQGLFKTFLAEEVASALRHSLRNKLAGARNANFFLKRKLSDPRPGEPDDPRYRKFFQVIDDEIQAASELLTTRLPSNTETAAGQRTDMKAVAARLLETVAGPGAVAVGGPACSVVSDGGELELALYCLVENAFEALGGAERVWERVSVRTAVGEGATARLEVSDEGPGLSADACARGFEPFFTTKARTFGFGLKIARRIAARWDGTVEAANKPGGGALVALVFPGEGASS